MRVSIVVKEGNENKKVSKLGVKLLDNPLPFVIDDDNHRASKEETGRAPMEQEVDRYAAQNEP